AVRGGYAYDRVRSFWSNDLTQPLGGFGVRTRRVRFSWGPRPPRELTERPGRSLRLTGAAEFGEEEGAGGGPVEVGGARGDAEGLGGLPDGQPGEEAERDDGGGLGLARGETGEGLVQGEQVVGVGRLGGGEAVGVEGAAGEAAAVAAPALAAGVLDQ